MPEWSADLEDWEYPDAEEEADEPATISCPHCQAEIYEDAVHCPNCEVWLSGDDGLGRRWSLVAWTILIALLLSLLGMARLW